MEVNGKVGEESVTVLEDENGEQFKVVSCNGLNFPIDFLKRGPEKRFSYVKNFPYQEGDLLLCSYPKTGTHWTANLLHFLTNDGSLDDTMSYSPLPIEMFDAEEVKEKEGRRIVTTHFPVEHLPTEHLKKGGKSILVFRNPKDTVVSLFSFLRKVKRFGDFKLSWNSFFEFWLQGKLPGGSYFDYYNKWQNFIEENPNTDVLIVQFEDLKKDSLNQLRRIQAYLGLNHPDERLQAVLDRCSLGNLKADVENGKLKTPLKDSAGKSALYNKGIVGNWKNQLTVAQNEKLDAIVSDKFKDSIFNYKTVN